MTLRKEDTNDVVILLEYYKDDIKLVYIDNYKRCCYLILTGFIIDYKEQVLIISIKVNI